MEVIYVLGVKGGIGKTTFSLYFANRLSSTGKKVLYIDHDYFSFGSLILGHNDLGLLEEIENNLPIFSRSLKNIDNLLILKLFSNPLNANKDYSLLNNNIPHIASTIAKMGLNYIILDSSVGILPDNDIVIALLENLNAEKKGVFITDMLSVNSTIKYAKLWENVIKYKILAINMVPPIPEDLSEAMEIANGVYYNNKELFNNVIVVPFDEKMYNYKPIGTEYENEKLNIILSCIVKGCNTPLIN
ncbi:AAA family ATPase [Sulfolobus sp. E5-1-F]|uniref:ParA family protein n=1 Tax=Sulfolobaceae TaxID=118883 RepID=UPI001297BC13|nr:MULTISPECIES: ParA family protein [unclassified Sulfolobus]QGA53483.1 AAA family ATPase [Sulfolobus sp. E5-1-F]QGA68844.1 AAA family ATPase [Sulfolobus sp. E11-6]